MNLNLKPNRLDAPKQNINLRVYADVAEQLTTIANEHGVTMSVVVRSAINDMLDNLNQNKQG